MSRSGSKTPDRVFPRAAGPEARSDDEAIAGRFRGGASQQIPPPGPKDDGSSSTTASKPVCFGPDFPLPISPISRATTEYNRTGSWRYLRPRYQNKIPPCRAGCPTTVPVQEVMALVRAGRLDDALREIVLENPLPGICGRVCFHPCEAVCNRKDFDSSLAIQLVERLVADACRDTMQMLEPGPPTGRTVAVIGSGPAGLAAAWFSARLGHSVTIFEAEKRLGGMPRQGIPAYRLPRAVLEREIQRIVSLGIEVKTSVRVGKDIAWSEIERFDAAFLAPGLGRAKTLGIEGESAVNVETGVEFLRRFNSAGSRQVGERLVVIGGGNTAIDVVRTAIRAGCREVSLYAVESRSEMPALSVEVNEADREGVNMQFGVVPTTIMTDENNRAFAVQLARARLGEPDASGFRPPSPVPGTERITGADQVVVAIGEQARPGSLPDDGALCGDEMAPRVRGRGDALLVAGGDLANRKHSVVTAIASGKRAAIAIDVALRGAEPDWEAWRVAGGGVSFTRYLGKMESGQNRIARFDRINTDYFEVKERARTPRLAVAERIDNFREVNQGLSPQAAEAEVRRCFHCGVCTACDNCYLFCPDVAVVKNDDGTYGIRYDYCKGCGVCVHECPRCAMEIAPEEE